MQANSEEVSSLWSSLTLSYTESSKRLHKDQHKNWENFWCDKKICKATTFDFGLYWKFKKVTQRSTSNLAEILMRKTSLPINLQHDEGKFWSIIIFTRSCKMLPFEHDLVQKVKKVRQRSTSNLFKILMWRISL